MQGEQCAASLPTVVWAHATVPVIDGWEICRATDEAGAAESLACNGLELGWRAKSAAAAAFAYSRILGRADRSATARAGAEGTLRRGIQSFPDQAVIALLQYKDDEAGRRFPSICRGAATD
jgi:hypothetical protein